MNKYLLIAASASLLFAKCAQSTCLVTPPNNVNSGAEFMDAEIRSLGQFQAAQSSLDGIAHASETIDVLTAFDVANEKLQCASDELQYFRNTGDKNRNDAVVALQSTASVLQSLDLQTKAMMVAQLNGDYANEKAGDHALRMSEQAKQYRDAWSVLPPIALGSFLTLVEYESPQSKKLGRLSITQTEKAQLNGTLTSNFPNVAKKTTSSLSQSDLAAYSIFVGLNKKNWPTHEQPFREP